MSKKLLSIVLLWLFSFAAWAEDSNGQYSIISFSNFSCGDFSLAADAGVTGQRSNRWNSYFAWTMGYLTAYNTLMFGTYDIVGSTDQNGYMGFLEKYCRENPLDYYSDAVSALVVKLYDKRQKSAD